MAFSEKLANEEAKAERMTVQDSNKSTNEDQQVGSTADVTSIQSQTTQARVASSVQAATGKDMSQTNNGTPTTSGTRENMIKTPMQASQLPKRESDSPRKPHQHPMNQESLQHQRISSVIITA